MLNILKRLLDSPEPAIVHRGPDASALPDAAGTPVPADERSLSPQARRWLIALPLPVWPKLVCVRRPQVANRLAALWNEPSRLSDYIEALLRDDSVAGADLPPALRPELLRLEAYRRRAGRAVRAVAAQDRDPVRRDH